MIPTSDQSELMFRLGVQEAIAPVRTWRMDIEKMRVQGEITDDLEAVRQMVYKTLNTEKGAYVIYPSFGVQTKDLFYRPKLFAYTKLRHRIREALLLDDRVKDVTDFVYHKEKSKRNDLVMSFTVRTLYGDMRERRVFDLG